jgi:hypothetical protein
MKEQTKNGIMYTWDIASSQGASFILFPESTHTQEQIRQAKAEIRNDHDVVSLKVADENDRDYLYKGEVFSIPETKPLKWYQIEQDERLLRRERKKGTTAQEFVNTYVLPFVKEIEAKLLLKHGDKIYGL